MIGIPCQLGFTACAGAGPFGLQNRGRAADHQGPSLEIAKRFSSSTGSSDDMEAVDTSARLRRLRQLMRERAIDVYVVPSEDSHQSEYIAAADARREFISGFTGSAGTAVVTQDKAALATDGRYFNQASKQLDANWELLKQGLENVPSWQEWAVQHATDNKTLGIDPSLVTASQARKLDEKTKQQGGKGLRGETQNLVDLVWGDARPPRPHESVKTLPMEYAGKSFQQKIEDLRQELKKKKNAGFVISMLDEIAWLSNLRGNDIPYNPVFFSYALVTPHTAILYMDKAKLTEDARAHLGKEVEIKPYDAIFKDLKALQEEFLAKKTANLSISGTESSSKYAISDKASWALSMALGGPDVVDEIASPVAHAKAIKNETELQGMRECHVRDGASLSEYFAWLEEEVTVKGARIDEVQGADKLEEIRSRRKNFVGLSFDTISSTGANAAVIHYKPEPGSCSVIDPKQVYLCDSGAQYLDGTTDTTRTVHFGIPTAMERKAYTLVLKGVISLDTAIFPKSTTGYALDAFARQHLWAEGLDYRHGTGHGVGSYLNVHEGPIGIGARRAYCEAPLAAGHVISDEPGYYEDGKFGIRIENIIMCRAVETAHQFGDKPYLGFEHVTMVPYCQKLIDVDLLTSKERAWIDDYHRLIYEKTKGFFEKDKRTMQWLVRETAPLTR